MNHSHPTVPVGRYPRAVLIAVLAAVLCAAIYGVVALWPDSHAVHRVAARSQLAAPGVTFPKGTVTKVEPACPASPDASLQDGYVVQQGDSCGRVGVRLSGGSERGRTVGVTVAPEVTRSGLRAGDTVQLMRAPGGEGASATYSYWTTSRTPALGWMLAAFVLLVVVIARRRGLMAVIGVGISGLVLAKFMLPALLTGASGPAVALAGTTVIMYLVLYTTHGFSTRTSVALAGTLLGTGLTAMIGSSLLGAARLTGVSDESAGVLAGMAGQIDLHGLLLCGVIVASLGVLNDVTITQASAVWELRAAAPAQPRRRVFAGAMRIGCDHVASTIYTIVFAYAGSAIVVLLILTAYGQPLLQLLSAEEISEEVVRTLVSGMGVVLAMPLTTALAAMVARPHREPAVAAASLARAPGPAVEEPVETTPSGAWDSQVPAARATTDDVYREFWGRR